MPEVSLGLNTSKDVAAIQALEQELQKALSLMRQLKDEMGASPGARQNLQGQWMGAIHQVSGLQGAIAGLQSSASMGGGGGDTIASKSAAAAIQAVMNPSAFGGRSIMAMGPEMVPGLISSTMQGIDFTKFAGANTQVPNMVASIVRQAQAAQLMASVSPMTMYTAAHMGQWGGQMPPITPGGPPPSMPASPFGPVPPPPPLVGGFGGGRGGTPAWWQTVAQGVGFGGGAGGPRDWSRYAPPMIMAGGLASGMNTWSQSIATGDVNPSEFAGMYGGMGGGLSGMVVGALSNPLTPGMGAATGGMMGYMLGDAAARLAIAPFMRGRLMAQTLDPIAARMGGSGYDLAGLGGGHIEDGTRPWRARSVMTRGNVPGGLSDIADQISTAGKSAADIVKIRSGLYTGIDTISGPQMAQVYSSIGMGMYHAGDDPSLALNPSILMARQYGINAPKMADMAGKVYSLRNQMGRNNTDLLMSVGTEAYDVFADVSGQPNLNPDTLKAYKQTQLSSWRARKASLMPRGAGAAMMQAYDEESGAIARLPGGRDSLAYAESRHRYRQARSEDFQELDIEEYGIPELKLEGLRARSRSTPFAPGNRFAIELSLMNLRSGHIKALEMRRDWLRSSGELSADQEYHLTSQIESMRTSNMEGIATISEGAIDRMPTLSAGAPGGFRRFDSMQLAAWNLGRVGSPVRAFGAMGGQQARLQEQFVTQFGMGSLNPTSRNAMDNPAAIDKLTEIANILRSMVTGGNSFPKVPRGNGGLGPDAGNVSTEGAPFNN